MYHAARPPFRLAARLMFLALLLLPSAGCLDFEKQTVVVGFPGGRDEVRILLIYHGFRVGGNKAQDLESAKEELTKLTTGEQDFYLASPLLHLSLAPGKDEKDDQKRVRELLAKHVAVRKCSLFTDQDGKLCGYQVLTVRDAQKLVTEGNALLSDSFGQWAKEQLANEKKRNKDWDKETLELVVKASNDKYSWVRLEPGRLSFSMPGSQAFFARAKREALHASDLESLQKQLAAGKPAPNLQAVRAKLADLERDFTLLSELPLGIDQRKDRLTVSLGFGDGQPITIPLPASPREPQPIDKDLAAFARTLKIEFRKGVTSDGLIAEFLKDVNQPK